MKIIKGELIQDRFLVPYRIYGQAEKLIVCISGAKQTMAAWRSFISHFISDYAVAVFDLPGQGRSKILSGSPGVSFDEQIDVLNNIISTANDMNRTTDKPVHLAAASWGTIVSAAYAARFPDRVDKMILGSFGSKPTQAVLDVIREGQKLFRKNQLSKIAPLMIECFGQYIPDTHKKQIVEQFRKMDREQYLSFYQHCEFVGQSTDIEEYVDLKNIKASTLIISGEYDAIIDQDDIAQASTRIPDCEYKMVPGAGHFLHWEREEILHTYREFLAR